MKVILLMAALISICSASALFFILHDWYGALGWFLVAGYQIEGALSR